MTPEDSGSPQTQQQSPLEMSEMDNPGDPGNSEIPTTSARTTLKAKSHCKDGHPAIFPCNQHTQKCESDSKLTCEQHEDNDGGLKYFCCDPRGQDSPYRQRTSDVENFARDGDPGLLFASSTLSPISETGETTTDPGTTDPETTDSGTTDPLGSESTSGIVQESSTVSSGATQESGATAPVSDVTPSVSGATLESSTTSGISSNRPPLEATGSTSSDSVVSQSSGVPGVSNMPGLTTPSNNMGTQESSTVSSGATQESGATALVSDVTSPGSEITPPVVGATPESSTISGISSNRPLPSATGSTSRSVVSQSSGVPGVSNMPGLTTLSNNMGTTLQPLVSSSSAPGACVDQRQEICSALSDLCPLPRYRPLLNDLCAKTCGFCPPAECKDEKPTRCPIWKTRDFCNLSIYKESTKKRICGFTCCMCDDPRSNPPGCDIAAPTTPHTPITVPNNVSSVTTEPMTLGTGVTAGMVQTGSTPADQSAPTIEPVTSIGQTAPASEPLPTMNPLPEATSVPTFTMAGGGSSLGSVATTQAAAATESQLGGSTTTHSLPAQPPAPRNLPPRRNPSQDPISEGPRPNPAPPVPPPNPPPQNPGAPAPPPAPGTQDPQNPGPPPVAGADAPPPSQIHPHPQNPPSEQSGTQNPAPPAPPPQDTPPQNPEAPAPAPGAQDPGPPPADGEAPPPPQTDAGGDFAPPAPAIAGI
ncbi:hypothetical protein Ddc_16546 [Ditylenchus destructor]|nr:hypothetical protein Ddc_16546 [Ditylenchus destructor]